MRRKISVGMVGLGQFGSGFVKRTGQIYMMGETSYYRPEVVYCRKKFAAGDLGEVVLVEPTICTTRRAAT